MGAGSGGPLPPDYHVHTERCGHASGKAREYVAAARSIGLPAVGIADHLPLVHTEHPDPTLAMGLDQLPDYVAEVHEIQREHPGYVLLGTEADFIPGWEDRTRELLASQPFDYVIGSVHFIDGWGFDDPRYQDGFEDRDVDSVYREYLDLVGRAAETHLFDIMGHLDLVKKFGHRAQADLREDWDRLARRLHAAGVAVEVNTAGLRKPVAEMYPSPEVLEILARRGVPLTFGSDAHTPRHVGRDFDRAVRLARETGHRSFRKIGS